MGAVDFNINGLSVYMPVMLSLPFGTDPQGREGVNVPFLGIIQMRYIGGETVLFGTHLRGIEGANARVLST